eukprot:SAG22_NODE_7_length_40155_cov_25.241356_17_plen_272_part_00
MLPRIPRRRRRIVARHPVRRWRVARAAAAPDLARRRARPSRPPPVQRAAAAAAATRRRRRLWPVHRPVGVCELVRGALRPRATKLVVSSRRDRCVVLLLADQRRFFLRDVLRPAADGNDIQPSALRQAGRGGHKLGSNTTRTPQGRGRCRDTGVLECGTTERTFLTWSSCLSAAAASASIPRRSLSATARARFSCEGRAPAAYQRLQRTDTRKNGSNARMLHPAHGPAVRKRAEQSGSLPGSSRVRFHWCARTSSDRVRTIRPAPSRRCGP